MSALNALFTGDDAARRYREEGRAALREGRAARKASEIGGFATALSGVANFARSGAGGSFFNKYGDTVSRGAGTGFSDFARQMPGPEWVA